MSSELDNLAHKVLTDYDIKPKSTEVMQSGGVKTVWRIDTGKNRLCLKRLRQPLEKALFTINAQNYMARKGAKVPAIYPARDGRLYILHNNQLFVLYQWITGKDLFLNNMSDLKNALRGLAAFHRDSAGYMPPANCRASSKLGRWPHHYNSMLERLRKWKQIASGSPNSPLSKVFLAHVDNSIRLGQKALAILEKSHYTEWVKEVADRKSLCHQDFGDGNVLLTPEGVYVIDLDSVTYDLPVRDLRKIIIKRMSARGKWDKELIHYIVSNYSQVNPLNKKQLQVLYTDLLFPHEFHDTAKNPYRKNKPIDAGKLVKAAKFEQGKQKILESLIS